MNLPNTMQICGKQYTIVEEDKKWGGSGVTGKQQITVGMSDEQTAERKFENFMHEVMEMVTCEQHVRYEASDDESVFVMTHKQFNAFANGVASAIMPMVKI